MILIFVIAIGIIVLMINLIIEYKKYKEYMNSDYYHMTHVPYWSMLPDIGKKGEFDTYRCLCTLDGYKKFLFNCYIPKGDGTTTEVDVILLHESGIYVLESKNYSGWIFGTETQKQWTQVLPLGKGKTRKEHFLNPIIQNTVHLKWLQTYLKDFENLTFYSCIVFSRRCELKKITLTSGNHFVVKRENLLEVVSCNVTT
ncbi:MAG: NERD domain-containing protein, partial [Lachnospiraceae bacterium]|nr:NERD domain-containing protein [Lachnospiraceae bacterium]